MYIYTLEGLSLSLSLSGDTGDNHRIALIALITLIALIAVIAVMDLGGSEGTIDDFRA